MANRILNSLGTVTKKERLSVAEHISDSPALVLETERPYAGYYGTTVPESDNARSIFFVTRHHYNDDKIIRSIKSVKKSFKHSFDGVPGNISFGNKNYPVIRIRYISHTLLAELISAFRKENIEFMPRQKVSAFYGVIKITKYFNTEEVDDGIFIDSDNPSFAYIQTNVHLRWPTFESITMHIKNNTEGITFDAALATMYDCTGVLDFVRIYDVKRSVDKLALIRSKYLEQVKRI